MPREERVMIFDFEELPSDIQKKIIKDHQYDLIIDGDYADSAKEDFALNMKSEIGNLDHDYKIRFDPDNKYFELSKTEGSGPSVFGLKLIDNVAKNIAELVSAEPSQIQNCELVFRGHKSPVPMIRFPDLEDTPADKEGSASNIASEAVEKLINGLVKKFFTDVENERDYLTSDNTVREYLANIGGQYLKNGSAIDDDVMSLHAD